MYYKFAFKGGVYQKTINLSEKFLLFFLVGGREIPFYTLYKQQIIEHTELSPAEKRLMQNSHEAHQFACPYKYVKIFSYITGFGVRKQLYSFYFEMADSRADYINILPLSGNTTGYFFNASGRFLSNDHVRTLLDPNSLSIKFLESQPMLPVAKIHEMITVTRNKIILPTRRIRAVRKA